MKVGILTPHSQLNYGGVLQAWAMLESLSSIPGVEAVFLDWWADKDNVDLDRGVSKWSLRRWLGEIVRAMLGLGNGSFLLRQWRTRRMMRRFYRLSSYHFCKWQEVAALDVDVVSVGSDQVWYYAPFRLPDPYLLEGLPAGFPAIAYAASFGMVDVPAPAAEVYRRGFRRFRAIGVREKSAVGIVEKLGARATHVADPTLLAGQEFWRRHFKARDKKRLVCYIISEDVRRFLPQLERFAREQACRVDVFVDSLANPIHFKSPFGGLARARGWCRMVWKRLFSPVRLHMGAGPLEFVKGMAEARWVFTDSFHGLMFSTIFEKNVRLIRPTIPYRIQMFSRISEFLSDFVDGDPLVGTFDEGLHSLIESKPVSYRREQIDAFVKHSRDWLVDALESCGKGLR